MKKRSVQVLAGMLSAGMLVLTGCGGAAATTGADTTGAETETVEYTAEETEAKAEPDHQYNSCRENTKVKTDYKSFDDVKKHVKGAIGSKEIFVRGYNGSVLAVAMGSFKAGESANIASDVRFYTKNGNTIYLAGELIGSNPVSVTGNGVITMTTTSRLETYYITSDGQLLEHKDFIALAGGENTWGYVTDDKDLSKQHEYTGKANDLYDLIDKANELSPIEFDPLEK
ncbi:MAG: hypothetical protein IKZ97_04980 [Butyrivibrio sp.]|nr:hypothetical protein [Butyrivibrio sp.]